MTTATSEVATLWWYKNVHILLLFISTLVRHLAEAACINST